MDADGNDNRPEWGYCQQEGCKEPAIPCYLPDNEPPGEPDDLLCCEHAPKHGYCGWCGAFWGGIESFEMNPSGVCDECRDDLVREQNAEAYYWCPDYDDEDEFYDRTHRP